MGYCLGMNKTPRTTKTLAALDALLAQARRDLSTLMARGQDPSYKVAEIDGLLARRAELAK